MSGLLQECSEGRDASICFVEWGCLFGPGVACVSMDGRISGGGVSTWVRSFSLRLVL